MYVWKKSQGSILSILFIFIAVVVAAPSAGPTSKEDVSVNTSPNYDPPTNQLVHNPHLPRNPVMRPIPAGASVTVAHGWIITARAITSFIVPVQTMASVLESFYQEALIQLAVNLFKNKPHPGSAFRLSIGSVNLALRAVNPGDYLTWQVCEVVVLSLLRDAQMGFTGQFRSEWYHPESGVLLYVSLGVLQRVGVGPVDSGF